jgi:hypothetical protein
MVWREKRKQALKNRREYKGKYIKGSVKEQLEDMQVTNSNE